MENEIEKLLEIIDGLEIQQKDFQQSEFHLQSQLQERDSSLSRLTSDLEQFQLETNQKSEQCVQLTNQLEESIEIRQEFLNEKNYLKKSIENIEKVLSESEIKIEEKKTKNGTTFNYLGLKVKTSVKV